MTRLRLFLATGAGLGYAPIAPGTFGSLPGVALVWLLFAWGSHPAVVAGCVVVTGIGIWASTAAERHYGRKDPGEAVIDEVAGQMVTLLTFAPDPWVFLAGFLLFRLFDIIKPPPARGLESLPHGSGIMADDLVAGLYANLALQAIFRGLPLLTGAG